jgi:hypothetical protein
MADAGPDAIELTRASASICNDTSRRGARGRVVLAIEFFDESNGLADGHDVLPLLASISPGRYGSRVQSIGPNSASKAANR